MSHFPPDFAWLRLGIYKSMKHLQSFRLFEAHTSGLTPAQEAFLNRYTQGSWSVNQQTGLVDVSGNFNCSMRRLKSFRGVSFGHVSGVFDCENNQLTTLEGAPQTVVGRFDCDSNQLTTLEGAPQVGGGFYCSNNRLTSLIGAPRTVGSDFWCDNNRLTSLVGAPQTVDGRFYCDAFGLERGEWIPSGWLKILTTGNAAAQRLILTLPNIPDPDLFLQKLSGDLKKDGQVLLQLAALWEEPGWAGQRREIEQRLSPEQLRTIKVLRTKLDYVNPWQGGVLTDLGDPW